MTWSDLRWLDVVVFYCVHSTESPCLRLGSQVRTVPRQSRVCRFASHVNLASKQGEFQKDHLTPEERRKGEERRETEFTPNSKTGW